jgi:hypothetical protein
MAARKLTAPADGAPLIVVPLTVGSRGSGEEGGLAY